MRDAKATWAIVVGIDTYDHVTHLTGAARDAAAAARWLLAVGVPAEQILLHTAPSDAAAAEVKAVGLAQRGCSEPDIWTSFEQLMSESGRRLFVFLCGHGFFEPGGDRVFLTREASERVMSNLGIDWYAKLLRGLPYEHQFLIMDGCLNLPYTQSERARFKAGEHAGVVPGPTRADVVQHFCYGAAQAQRASEVDGRGIFLKTLLETLDLGNPHPDCVDVDDEEGARVLDLERAVRDVCAPTVSTIVAKLGRTQQPGIQMLSMGATPRTLPVVRIGSSAVANVRVMVRPPAASDQVARLHLWSDSNIFSRRLPVPPAVKVTVPYASRLPRGLPVAVRCTVEPAGGWAQPSQQEFVTDMDRDVVFELEQPQPPAATAEVVVNTIDAHGDVVSGVSDIAYSRIDEVLADSALNIDVERHETGPVLRSRSLSRTRMWDAATEIARTIGRNTPAAIGAVVRQVDAAQIQPAVQLRITAAHARQLGGLLQHEAVVEVGDSRRSLSALVRDPLVPVEPGPVTIRLALPWGEWHERVVVDQAAPTRVELPRAVGVPPLRVRLLARRKDVPESPRFGLVTLGRHATLGTIRDAAGTELGRLERGAARVLQPAAGLPRLPRWRVYAHVRGLALPLSADGAVALELADEPRAEPLSWTSEPNWDRLVSSGRLEDLSEEQAAILTYAKWESPLLGLAGAYACYARGRDDLLPIVLTNLAGLDAELPDLPILEAALDRRLGRRRKEVTEALAALGDPPARPLFRWGVGIGVLAAEHHRLPALAASYRELEPRLAAGSVWSVWHE
jgi:hypothetical protein